MNLPRFYKWDGGDIIPDTWAFGYLTGIDNDLICVKDHLNDTFECEEYLSPVCKCRLLAILQFIKTRWVK